MELTPVNGSNVLAIGYSGTTLTVQFKSGTYDYFDVGVDKWEAIQKAMAEGGSVGSVISGQVVKNHKFLKHEEPRHGS